jgi:NAD(P)H-hydrate repair Nnr-like enzyme with NAD(P)H-hydrate dehydratase domain
MKIFDEKGLKNIYKPGDKTCKHDNGSVLVIGGSMLFHGAPILALKTISRMVDMTFFSSPENTCIDVAAKIKSSLSSFIWVPWAEVNEYVEKSGAILIGPGMMRCHEKCNIMSKVKSQKSKMQSKSQNFQNFLDKTGLFTKKITEDLLKRYPEKQWVIDAGSLQVMDKKYIPKNAILTPNKKEFEMLFGKSAGDAEAISLLDKSFDISRVLSLGSPARVPPAGKSGAPAWGLPASRHPQDQICESLLCCLAKKYQCTIVLKLVDTLVISADEIIVVKGGNAGLTKGGTGDVMAGLTAGFAAKNDPILSACAGAFITKKAAEELYKKVGFAYNADDLAGKIPEILGKYFK